MGKFGVRNKVSTNILDFNICLLGESKSGKTTLVKEVCEKVAGEDGAIFLEIGSERGADAIEGIVYENVEDYDKLMEIVDDIVENKTTDYPNLKVLVCDTYDQLLLIYEQAVIRMWNRKNPDKKTDSINGAYSGFGRGEAKVLELIDNMVIRLHNVGVRVFWIGHVKNKDITDVASGETYTTLTSDQTQKYFNHLKKTLHVLGLAYIDREITKEKVKDKFTGKDKMKGKLVGETRRIKLRDDNYAVDSGSRFAHIVSEIPMDADSFIEAIEDAIKAEIESQGGNVKEREKENKKEEVEFEKEVAQKEAEAKANKVEKEKLDEITSKIKTFIVENKSDLELIKPVLAKAKELGYANPMEVDDIEDAIEIAKLIKE